MHSIIHILTQTYCIMLLFVIAFHRSVDSLLKFPHLVLWLGLVSSPDTFECVHVEEGSGEHGRVLVTAARMLAAQIRSLFHIYYCAINLVFASSDGEYVRWEIRSRRCEWSSVQSCKAEIRIREVLKGHLLTPPDGSDCSSFRQHLFHLQIVSLVQQIRLSTLPLPFSASTASPLCENNRDRQTYR